MVVVGEGVFFCVLTTYATIKVTYRGWSSAFNVRKNLIICILCAINFVLCSLLIPTLSKSSNPIIRSVVKFTWQDWLSLKMHGEEIKSDGYEDAFLGICRSPEHGGTPVAAYDFEMCIEVLMGRDGMTYEDAVEFFKYNTLQAYVGPNTPHYITLYEEEE